MTHPGFLRAICEDPDDDAHRLIYADWLDDHGDSDRAEFIRLQCALAATDDEDEAMKKREAELLRLHGETWLAELPALHNVNWVKRFRRGFVEMASLPHYTAWRDQGLALLAVAPLEMVYIWQVTPNTVRRLARSPGIDRVRGLDFPMGNFGDEELEVLGESSRLQSFTYRSPSRAATMNLEHDAGRVLGARSGFERLRRLCLGNTRLNDDGAARLGSGPNLGNLEELQLHDCGITSPGVVALLGHAS